MKKEKKKGMVGKDLLLGKGTLSFQAINKGTPAAATAPLLLLLLLNELHGRGRWRGRPHGPHHFNAVLGQR